MINQSFEPPRSKETDTTQFNGIGAVNAEAIREWIEEKENHYQSGEDLEKRIMDTFPRENK